MGITVYEPAPAHPDERRRERAVEDSRVLDARNDPVLQTLVETARLSFKVSMAAVSIIYGDYQYLIAASGLPTGPYGRRTSFCGHVIVQQDPVFCVPDALADKRFANSPAVLDDSLVRFYAGAMLVGQDNMPLGALCVWDRKPRDCFPGHDEICLRSLAEEVMERIASFHR